MIQQILTIREYWNGYSLIVHAGKPEEQVVAMRIPEEFMARQFAIAPELINAALVAASVLKCGGLHDMSEQIAYERLEEALAAVGVAVDTPATRELAYG
ncbi:hypothetical protein [Undibacterium sp.]|jgi:hypothetical protein|uniref:hypothetical protein n=1 Tax=Undibacterium sp. TaxID=1914977 RepID=UPI002B6EDE35|nr:hypothetical protein [Undibacterium sp.]HTD05878.1 hypothetical protein [Undibacterium sp.]